MKNEVLWLTCSKTDSTQGTLAFTQSISGYGTLLPEDEQLLLAPNHICFLMVSDCTINTADCKDLAKSKRSGLTQLQPLINHVHLFLCIQLMFAHVRITTIVT